MTLAECLSHLHRDLLLVNMHKPGYLTRSVAELQKTIPADQLNEDGYELRTHGFNFGRTQKKAIGKVNGPNLWNEW